MSRSLRFLMATTFFPPFHFGGDAICVLRLTRALAARGSTLNVWPGSISPEISVPVTIAPRPRS